MTDIELGMFQQNPVLSVVVVAVIKLVGAAIQSVVADGTGRTVDSHTHGTSTIGVAMEIAVGVDFVATSRTNAFHEIMNNRH